MSAYDEASAALQRFMSAEVRKAVDAALEALDLDHRVRGIARQEVTNYKASVEAVQLGRESQELLRLRRENEALRQRLLAVEEGRDDS